LVDLHELFSEGNDWFFTMEYVEGQDFLTYMLGESTSAIVPSTRGTRPLRGVARCTPGMEVLFPTPLRSFERLRDVLHQVVSAVSALHAAGKLHRDLKPDNLMVTREGRAVVLDFGISAEREGAKYATAEPGLMGTPAYMSPEQAAGRAASESSDWYALGVLLFEALTGQVPFDGDYADVLTQKQRVDPPAPSRLVSGVPEDLDALCVQMLARDPEQRPQAHELLAAFGGSAEHVRTALTRSEAPPPFLGRAQELGELERALAATDSGTPVVALVHGMTGMGKTALVERFLEAAADRGAVVLSGRCYEHEMVALKAIDSIADMLSRYLIALPSTEAAELVPRDVHALAQLFPVLQRVEVIRTARRRAQYLPDARTLRQQAIVGLKELLSRIAMRQPLVLFIDDLQWGDVDSARILAHLTGGADRPAMLLICTYRTSDQERSPCLSKLLPLIRERRQVQAREIVLEPLSERESLELGEKLLQGGEGDPLAIARESRGNPYLLAQLIDHVRSERSGAAAEDGAASPVSLERALSDRLSALSPAASSVLAMIALSSRPLREQVLAELAAGDMNLAVSLTELRRQRLVRGIGSNQERAVGIYHDGIREALVARMTESEARQLHARLASATERCQPLDSEALIDHLLGAHDFSRAGIYAIGAAQAAMAAFAFDKAAALLEIAAQHHADGVWRQELLVQWAGALASAGRSLRAAEVYLDAAKHAPPGEREKLELRAGAQFLLSGRWDRGVGLLTSGLAVFGITFPQSIEEALVRGQKLRPRLEQGGFEFATRMEADLSSQQRERLNALWEVVQATLAGYPLVCQLFVRQYLIAALDSGARSRIVLGLCAYFMTVDIRLAWIDGRRPESLQRAETLCRDVADPHCHAWIAVARAFACQNEGLIKPAILHLEQATDLLRSRCREGAALQRTCRMLHARALAMSGDLDDLARCELWIREADDCDDLVLVTRLRLIASQRLLAEDDIAGVETRLEAPVELQSEGFGLTGLLRFASRINLATYQLDGQALLRLARKVDAIYGSPLIGTRLWSGDYQTMRARLLLAASLFSPEREAVLARAENAIEALEKLDMECHADYRRILRAALLHQRGRTQEVLELLDTILTDDDGGGESVIVRACARMGKGHLLGGESGSMLIADGERELHARGVKDPLRFARLYAPGFA
jgi:tetratricopeptide (TPR) repeat protein